MTIILIVLVILIIVLLYIVGCKKKKRRKDTTPTSRKKKKNAAVGNEYLFLYREGERKWFVTPNLPLNLPIGWTVQDQFIQQLTKALLPIAKVCVPEHVFTEPLRRWGRCSSPCLPGMRYRRHCLLLRRLAPFVKTILTFR